MKKALLPKIEQPNTQKTQSLQDIIDEFGPIISVYYKPFKCEPKQIARALLPLLFPRNAHLFDYFSLFFTHDILRTITTNTNRYANLQSLYI